MKSKSYIIAILACMFLLFMALPAAADIKTDTFYVQFSERGEVVPMSGSSGYTLSSEQWFAYPNAQDLDPAVGETPEGFPSSVVVYNTWFYDDPVDTSKLKRVSITMPVLPIIALGESGEEVIQAGGWELWVNWSTADYSVGPDGAPPTSDQEVYIERLFLETDFWTTGSTGPNIVEFTWEGILPVDYNPEWVSIDLRGFNFIIDYTVNSSITGLGIIEHECFAPVPIPGAIWLLGAGLLGLFGAKRKLRS